MAQYSLQPVDDDPFGGADSGVAFDTANKALQLTEDDKQRAAQAADFQRAAEAEANPVQPRQAFLQGLDPRVDDATWGKDLYDSLTKEGASEGTKSLAKNIGIAERFVAHGLLGPSDAMELGRQSELTRQFQGMMSPEEQLGRRSAEGGQGLGLALGLASGATPFAEPGALGIFGGRLGETASGPDLVAAQLKSSLGVDPKAIWQRHGWYQDVDGKWKYEIPDQGASLHPDATPENLPPGHNYALGDALDHPAFFAAYPEAKDWGLTFSDLGSSKGMLERGGATPTIHLNPNLSRSEQLSTLLHEAQHGVQEKEGFAMGAAPATLQPQEQAYVEGMVPRYNELASKAQSGGLAPQENQELGRIQSLFKQYNDFHNLAFDNYSRSAGETEARNVQARAGLSPDDLRATHPDLTADILPRQRRVAFDVEGGPMSAAPQAPKPLLASGWHPDAHNVLQREHDFLAPQLGEGSDLLARIQEMIDAGPGEAPSISDLHHPIAREAQLAHEAAAPQPLQDIHQQMIQELQASRQPRTQDGETFWHAPEPSVPYTQAQADHLSAHGYHMVKDPESGQRSWVWNQSVGQSEAPKNVSIHNPEQQPNVTLQTSGMQTTPEGRLASAQRIAPTDDPALHGDLTHLLAKGDMQGEDFLHGLFTDQSTNHNISHWGKGNLEITASPTYNGEPAGHISRIFDLPNNTVKHDYFEFAGPAQGQGLGKQMLASQMALYSRLGLDKVKLFANIDVGGYAWAKYGFAPEKQVWDRMRPRLQGAPELEQLPEDVREEVDKHLASPNPQSLWHLSDMTYPVEQEGKMMPLGKALLLGENWHGELKLNNSAAMERFHAYTQAGK